MKNIIVLFFGFIIICSCNIKIENKLNQNNMRVIDNELYIKILSSEIFDVKSFSILLPDNYEIETIDDKEDFIIFNINSKDELIGGIYLGNHPSQFIQKGNIENILVTEVESILLGKNIIWKIYFNESKYFTETIIENKPNNRWNQLIHLWIMDESLENIKRNILLFSTLERI